jgi:endonuclease/exonuclease/phosphatase family metal-dependent hydrolase
VLNSPDKLPLDSGLGHQWRRIAGGEWNVFNVHLEAYHVGTRMDHARRLAALVGALPDKTRVLVAGDFNAPPPEATRKKGFVDEPEADFSHDDTVAIARGMGLEEVLPDPAVLTYPADAPTRRLDDVFFGTALRKLDARVLTAPPGPWSDHLPIYARFRIQ